MKKLLLLPIMMLLLWGCGQNQNPASVYVQTADELNQAIEQASPGSEIVLSNGVWKDVRIRFYGQGTKEKPISLRAETPGEVFIEGQSYVHLGGAHLVVKGLHFRNGYSPGRGVIRYKIGRDSIASHCRVTECVIEGFTQPNRWNNDRWIELYGRYNQLDHCYISGKGNDGATLMVYHNGNEHIKNHHQIVYNYFGPRPRKGGPRAETMRLGGSETSMAPGYVNVSNNYFEACNGEVEIISDKTNFNTFTNNIFYKCEGSLVLRHADYATVDGNMFIGDDDSDFYGGVRAINTGHWITNNYFYKIRGEAFRTPLAMMNGIPKSSLNRYKQVTDVVVAYNSWIDCTSPWQIGVGQNKGSADVLPASEIRSAPPIRSTIANNLIYNRQPDASPVVNHDDIDGILFKHNILDNAGSEFTAFDALENASVRMQQVNDWLFVPEDAENDMLGEVFNGFDFDKIQQDIFGTSRAGKNRVGAIVQQAAAASFKIDKKQYGPTWYTPEKAATEPTVHTASSAEGALAEALNQADSGDIIELSDPLYSIDASLRIDKDITIRAQGENKVELIFKGGGGTPAFEMNPQGSLRLQNIQLKGAGNQLAFAPLAENMSSAYNLFIDNCVIEGFGYVLQASKGSFADSLQFSKTIIRACENGLVLAADERGDYNAEMVSFDQCAFTNVSQNVIHFYRGGYDESTIGGFLTLTNNTFAGCGAKEKSGILIRTTGIINVRLEDNSFQNNPVRLVALLWGAKNNVHAGNSLSNSGEIKVQENIELKLLY